MATKKCNSCGGMRLVRPKRKLSNNTGSRAVKKKRAKSNRK